MAIKYTGGKTVTVTVNNLASDTVACAYWYTGAVSPKGYSYVIKGLLDDGNNSTSTDFSYNTVLKGENSSNTTATTTFKTVDNIYDTSNARYPTYVWAYVNLLPHFHNASNYGSIIKSSYVEVRQRQNSISSSNNSFDVYWNEGGGSNKTISPTITCSPSNSYTKTINVSHSNASITESNSTVTSGNALNIKVKGKGSSTITLSPSDGAGGTSTTISVTGKTAVTNMTATYSGHLNTGAGTSMIVSKTPSDANADSFTITRTGTAIVSASGMFGASFNIRSTGSSPVITVTSADGQKSNSFKITNYTASVVCSGSTPLRGQTFTYTQSGGYGSGTYSFINCEHAGTGVAKVTANSGSAIVKWTPDDGGSERSGSINLGVSTTGISATGYNYNLNTGASTSVTVSRTPSNSKVGTFTSSVTSGNANVSSGNYGNATISNTSGSPVVKFTSGDGFVSTSIKIANHTASVDCSGKGPTGLDLIRNNTFTYTQTGGYGTGTYSFTNCKHYSEGKAEVTAYSGTATVNWTPDDGGTVRSGSINLGVTTTSIAINGNTSNYVTYINNGATANMTVNMYGPNNATPTWNKFTAGTDYGDNDLRNDVVYEKTNGSTVSFVGKKNDFTVSVLSGDGFVKNYGYIYVYNPSVSITASTPIYDETFTYSLSNYTGSGAWTFTNCKHYSAGKAQVTAYSGTASVKWKPNDGGTAVSKSTTLGVTTTSVAFNGNTGADIIFINNGASKALKIDLYGPNKATPKNTTFTISARNAILSKSSGTTGDIITVSNTSASAVAAVTVLSGDKKVVNGVRITTKNPKITLSNTTNNWKGNTFTYELSNEAGSGTWQFTNCTHYSTSTAIITGTSGYANVKWTPNDGGTPVRTSLQLRTYTTSNTSIDISLIGNYSYYDSDSYGPIYWRDYTVNVSNAQGRNVNLSISSGCLRVSSMSPETTSLNISSGSTIWARRNPENQTSPLTASVDAKTVISASSYTFYKGASTTTMIS